MATCGHVQVTSSRQCKFVEIFFLVDICFFVLNFIAFFSQNFELSRRNSNPKRGKTLVISCLQEIPVVYNFLGATI